MTVVIYGGMKNQTPTEVDKALNCITFPGEKYILKIWKAIFEDSKRSRIQLRQILMNVSGRAIKENF